MNKLKVDTETPSGTGEGGREVAWALTSPASSFLEGMKVGVMGKHATLCTVRSKLGRKMGKAKAKSAGLPKYKKGQICVALFSQDHSA